MSATATTSAVSSLKELVVSTIDQEPYISRTVTNQGERYEGYLVDLLNEIAKRVGFSYKFKQAADGNYGSPRPEGWTGVIGDVLSGKADIGGAALTVTPAREEVVDFTESYMSNSVNLLVHKPTWTDLGLTFLLRPFTVDYWVLFLVVVFLIGLVFFIIGTFSPYEWGNVAADKDPRGAKNSFTLRNSYLFALSTLTWQGFREAPHSISGRVMAAFWWMFVLFTLISYTANLTVYMLARPEQLPEMPFRTYEDLLQSSIRVGAINFGSTQAQLRTSKSATLNKLWTKINSQNSWIDTQTEGVQRVETSNGNFVMLMETATAEFFARKNCKLMIFGDNLFPTSLAFALKKGSPWKNKINEAIENMKQDGVLDLLKDKYWRFSGECLNIDGRKFIQTGGYLSSLPIYPITLKDMSVATLLLFLGFIAAMVFLVVEVIHYAVTKQGKKLEKPKIFTHTPKIFKLKPKAAKAEPAEVEGEAGPSSDGLESVPLEDAEEPALSSDEGEKAQV